ncbi:energy-coupling factor ABC transporter ATP-binding protein [Corynebacterium sp. LK26]|uniref:energy-coupling factor ABC transporter ATP-binding protein n=1 Tax=Corynebacterium sp. LK26 TaxID=2044581 RepID=UPI00165222FB|nr:ABC transporter ATP-binding protein [Corynebacterium sp. LK26]MBC6793602.1 cobalt ABC transporter [Corynebacterium sp. LK26]
MSSSRKNRADHVHGANGVIVEAAAVTYAYDETHVLKGVDLAISGGERLALLGANGSGKSTLLRMLAGASKPNSGEVRLDGTVYTYSRHGRNAVRRSVQMVTQDPDEQIFAASVFADVSFGPVNLGLKNEEVERRVRQALGTAEITDLAERVPHQLSYGQRKRVALAGALAMHPRVLLLDEPSAGLDPQATRKLAHTLNQLRDQSTAVVVATHDIDFAWNFADRAAVLADGKLRVGAKEDILADRRLVEHARLALPWAPVVSKAIGRDVCHPEDV